VSAPTASGTAKPPVGATTPARVLAVAAGSPAARAGVGGGDVLLSINGGAVRDGIR
jgi:S1-C subfamily serine protease